ncbi:hypothetical protein FQZ97_1208880 [compost metagenome]
MLAEAAVAVEHHQRALVQHAFGAALRVDAVALEGGAVVGQDRQAVADIAAAVGFDQVLGHVVSDVGGHLLRGEDVAGKLAGAGEGDLHGSYLLRPSPASASRWLRIAASWRSR